MSFLRIELWPLVALVTLLLVGATALVEQRFYRWVRAHWLFARSTSSSLASLSWVAGFALLTLILLDPREPEVRIKGKVLQTKTIILIDTSTSMLCEDVRPNRLEKAVMIAKHFARNAVGHQVSIMAFADVTKRLTPFTTDRDLIEARLDSLRLMRNQSAGSAIGLAIAEAVRYFDFTKDPGVGNVVVITDGEETATTEKLALPKGISLMLVGVGTPEGGPIPQKSPYGDNFGNKKYKSSDIITKLNEDYFKALTAENSNASYVLTRAYDLPTSEVLGYFENRKNEMAEGENVVRPVAIETIAVPALVLMLAGMLLRLLPPFALCLALALVAGASGPAVAEEKKLPPLPAEVSERIDRLKRGELDAGEKINLADQLVRHQRHALAQTLYDEAARGAPGEVSPQSYFNWATSELESGKLRSAIAKYDRILNSPDFADQALRAKAEQNLKKAFAAPPPSENDKKNKDEKKDNKKDKGSSDGSSQEKSEQAGEQEKNPFDPKNQDENKDRDGADKPEPDSAQPNDEEKNSEREAPQVAEEKGEKKPSPLLEQLKQDDRKLQMKLMKTDTQQRNPGRKDW